MKLEPEFTYTVELEAPQVVGPGPYGLRQVLAVAGGKLSGDRLHGTVLGSGGADWMLIGEDGYGRLDVRGQFLTDDDAVLYLSYVGLVEVTDAALAALADGPGTDFGDHYFVTTPRLESGDPRYAWVNQSTFVGQGRIQPGPTVEFRVFRVVP